MKRILAVALALAVFVPTQALAHTPLTLLNSDTTAAKGPLIVDGTVTFAVQAAFVKAGEKKAFRAGFMAGDQLVVQYLIRDKNPDRSWKRATLPSLAITSPSGKMVTLKLTEPINYFEKGTKTEYLSLSSYNVAAEEGVYSFVITSRIKSAMTVSVGENYRAVGDVTRDAPPAA